MKRLLTVALTSLLLSTSALAETFYLISPQKPAGGTSIWTQIVANEMRKHMPGDKIVVKHIPGVRGIPGFNKFHNSLRLEDNMIMVSNGGNGVSFLQEPVDYNYNDYDSVALMNLNIIVGKNKSLEIVGNDTGEVKFASASGRVPEAYAMALLLCGPNMNVDEYGKCFKNNVVWVNGMQNGERRLAFKRKELTADRENPAAYKKYIEPNDEAEIWFHHGILQLDGTHADDPNYPGYQLEALYEQKWGVKPSGDFYDAYKLIKSFRDGLQKALWVNKGNPNLAKLRGVMEKVASDPVSMANIQKKVGIYKWKVGEEGNKQRDVLMSFVTEEPLKILVKFNKETLGINSVYKPQLLNDINK